MLKPAARTVAIAPAKAAPAVASSGVTTATLIRGRVYFYKDTQFLFGQPVEVTAELGTALEELHEAIPDSEGEVFEKAFFHVRRNQPKPGKVAEDGEKRTVRRLPIVPLSR